MKTETLPELFPLSSLNGDPTAITSPSSEIATDIPNLSVSCDPTIEFPTCIHSSATSEYLSTDTELACTRSEG